MSEDHRIEEVARIHGIGQDDDIANLTTGILILSSIQGKPYEEQIEILGATIIELSKKLRQILASKPLT